MSDLGLPFQGKLWYIVQTSYSSGVTDTDTALPVSCKIQDCRWGIGDKHKELRGFDAPNACELLEQCSDLTFHLEYIPQCDDTLLEDVVNRTSEFKLQSLGFVILANARLTTTADRSAFKLCGCKPKTIRLNSNIDNEWLFTIDFSVKDITIKNTDGELNVPSEPSKLTGAYLAFNVAGAIQKDGADVAHILESIDVTIDHDLRDKYDHDSLVKQYCVEGKFSATGSVDISLDEGGGSHADEILNQTEFDLVIDFGGSGCPRLTLPNCKWKSGENDQNISGDIPMDSAPFTSKPTDGDLTSLISSTP